LNLVIAFASVNIYRSNSKQNARDAIYLQSLRRISKVLPKDTKFVIIENTNFLSSPVKTIEAAKLVDEFKMHEVFSIPQNLGTSNKGIGELSMLLEYSKTFLTDNFRRIAYLTLRQIHTSPYALERILQSEKPIVVSNPDFYFLDGRSEYSKKGNQFNDMCFGGDLNTMIKYVSYFEKHLELMLRNQLSSEQLLWKYVTDEKIETEDLNMLGVLRCAGDDRRNSSAWHYI